MDETSCPRCGDLIWPMNKLCWACTADAFVEVQQKANTELEALYQKIAEASAVAWKRGLDRWREEQRGRVAD